MKLLVTLLLTCLLASTAALTRTSDANAAVRFSDGVQMAYQLDCDAYGYNRTVFNFGAPQTGYWQTRVYSHQTGRWIIDFGWRWTQQTFTHTGWNAAPARGWFTFRTVLGRYVNGQFVAGLDVDQHCYF